MAYTWSDSDRECASDPAWSRPPRHVQLDIDYSKYRPKTPPPTSSQRLARWQVVGLVVCAVVFLGSAVGLALSVLQPSGPWMIQHVTSDEDPAWVNRPSRGGSGSGVRHASDAPKIVTLKLATADHATDGDSVAARYVVPARESWGRFVEGVQERLKLPRVSRIETALGEEIMSTSDVIDHDVLLVRS